MIASDLTTIVSEVLYVHDSHGATASSPSKSRDHSAIHRAPSAHQRRANSSNTPCVSMPTTSAGRGTHRGRGDRHGPHGPEHRAARRL